MQNYGVGDIGCCVTDQTPWSEYLKHVYVVKLAACVGHGIPPHSILYPINNFVFFVQLEDNLF